ncbi:WxcM-like domain-containing protein [Romboutsia sp. CE17]|uniref:sugar 3,4-ketoisomerase n=1 Tax=Romboutsia sp. CE17 TaxID=2724150 RepID=UPI001442C086|nr:FdtA/QdtA family cupin domain-containing protein [Romboutsia sp. CE17]QJA09378.1 WxcM-like domain-containing protein [Romboutsia sp. CE17]
MFNSYKFDLKEKNNNGILVPLEENYNIPFEIKRIFYTYNIPSNEIRGNHAYRKTRQVIICISGSVKIKCFDGKEEKVYELTNPSQGVYIDPKIWRTTYNHSSDCVLLILSSHEYNEDDYIRDYDEFMGEVRCI